MKKELNTGAFAAIIAVVVILVAIVGWKFLGGSKGGQGDGNQTTADAYAKRIKGGGGSSAGSMGGNPAGSMGSSSAGK